LPNYLLPIGHAKSLKQKLTKMKEGFEFFKKKIVNVYNNNDNKSGSNITRTNSNNKNIIIDYSINTIIVGAPQTTKETVKSKFLIDNALEFSIQSPSPKKKIRNTIIVLDNKEGKATKFKLLSSSSDRKDISNNTK